jgi:probable rRNA maturation factor
MLNHQGYNNGSIGEGRRVEERASPGRAHIEVLQTFAERVRREQLGRVVERAIAAEPCPTPALPTVVIADDATVRDLNRRHRGLDEVTDVLAFSFRHEGEYYGEDAHARASPDSQGFVLPPDEEETLGDVIVSYQQAERQARAAGHPVDRELAALVAHGVLHLLGYDHMSAEEEAAMKAKEATVLAGDAAT